MFEKLFSLPKFAKTMVSNYYDDNRNEFYNVLLTERMEMEDEIQPDFLSKILNGQKKLPQNNAKYILNNENSANKISDKFAAWDEKNRWDLGTIAPQMKRKALCTPPILWNLPNNIYYKRSCDAYTSLQGTSENNFADMLAYCFWLAIYNDWFIHFCMPKEKNFTASIKSGADGFKNKNISVDTAQFLWILLDNKYGVLQKALSNCFPKKNLAEKIFKLCEENGRAKKEDGNQSYNQKDTEEKINLIESNYANEQFFTYSLFEYHESTFITKILNFDEDSFGILKKEILYPGSFI